MQLSLIDTILSGSMARAICWTLVHSCWEGILAAALAGLIMASTRRRPAGTRYNLLAADLLLFLLLTGATFGYEYGKEKDRPEQQVQGSGILQTGNTGLTAGLPASAIPAGRVGEEGLIQQAADYLNKKAAAVTLIWLTCLVIQLLRTTGGWYQTRRLRRDRVAPPGEYWNARLSTLAYSLGIKKRVTLLQSGWITAPAVVGLFKPFILLPLGVLTDLPPDQVETILLHELAHIRRGDYAMNLLLHFTEAFFFFNPGVRWIANLLRQEREACCDDIVLAGSPDRNSYFEALLAFTQLAIDGRRAGPFLSLQLAGGKTDLLWRIRRMLDKENRKLQNMEKAIVSFGLLIIASVCLIGMNEKNDPAIKQNIPQGLMAGTPKEILVDTLPLPKAEKASFITVTSRTEDDKGRKKYHAWATDEKGNHYEIRILQDSITEFRVNKALVPKEDYERYIMVLAGFAAEEHAPLPPTPVAPPPPPPGVSSAYPPGVPPVPPVGVPPPPPGVSSLPQVGPPPAITPPPPIPATPITSEAPPTPAQPEQPEQAPTPASPLVYTKDPNPYVKLIAADLVAAGLIEKVENFSFTLDAGKLIVNGKKQPAPLFEKYKEKYIRHTRDHFIYSQHYTPHSSGSYCEVYVDDTVSTPAEAR